MGKSVAPKNWPSSIPYLLHPSLAPHLAEEQRVSLRTRPSDLDEVIPSHFSRGPCSLVRIVPIKDPSHPANGQAGLFAARHLGPGTLILPYYGLVHSSLPPHSLPHDTSDYDLWLNREAGVAVDAAKAGNEARFVNDYRGVRERPNAEFKQCWDARSGQQCMAVFVLPAGKNAPTRSSDGGITKGAEILVSYGKGFWSKRQEEQPGAAGRDV
ncbi:putative set domain-containing protein [Rosellinia necatrix]|uniref:Putative set domain-containing protein n=1 Tax=Rosellinia necatrix TaxID=77044 RepID=A0A1W2TJF7_ROSNE|nr:putative set domain-containing protein [Rosellinia necatrix]